MKELEIILKLVNDALTKNHPVILVTVGDNQTGVIAHGEQKDLIYALVKVMAYDKGIAQTINGASQIFKETKAAEKVAEGVQRFLTDCLDDIKDVPGNEHNPLDCENCKEHGKCDVEKMWNEMFIKKISKNGHDYQA